MKIGLNFNITFCYSILLVLQNAVSERKKGQGPYKMTVLKSAKCEKLSAPYEKDPAAVFSCEIYNNTKGDNLLSGSLTIVRVDPNRKISVKGFLLEDNKWRLMYTVNSRGCRGFLTNVLHAALRLGGRDTCSIKGTFHFQNIDFNKLQHKWKREAEYGLSLIRIDITSPLGTTICWEYEVLTEPK